MPKYILLIGGVPYSTSNPTSYVEAEDGINKIIRNREKIEGKDVGNLYEFHNKSPENLKETRGYWKCKHRNLEGFNPPLEIQEVVTTEITPDEIAQHLLDDDDYRENIKDMILFYLGDSNNLKYWKAWFEGKEGKELEDADTPLILVSDSYYAKCPHGNLIKFSWGADDLFYTLDSKGRWQQSNPDLFKVTQIKIVGDKECDTQPPTVLDKEDLEILENNGLEVFADVVGDDPYNYAVRLLNAHNYLNQ